MSARVFAALISHRTHAGILLNPHPDVCVVLHALSVSCVCSTGRPPPSGQYPIPGRFYPPLCVCVCVCCVCVCSVEYVCALRGAFFLMSSSQ